MHQFVPKNKFKKKTYASISSLLTFLASNSLVDLKSWTFQRKILDHYQHLIKWSYPN